MINLTDCIDNFYDFLFSCLKEEEDEYYLDENLSEEDTSEEEKDYLIITYESP